ncbi:MAG: DUF4252 domain-containing protein [Bacteroidota bacterium]
MTTLKKLLLLPLFLLATVVVYGQSKTLDSFYNKYKDDRDATTVTVSGSIFNLISAVADLAEETDDEEKEELEAFSRMAKNIKSMQVISVPMFETDLSLADIESLRKSLKAEKYEELMNVKEGKEIINFMAQTSKNEVSNMLVLIQEKDEFTILNIDGRLDLKDLAVLASSRDKWSD